jgi:hypothetical protein
MYRLQVPAKRDTEEVAEYLVTLDCSSSPGHNYAGDALVNYYQSSFEDASCLSA